MLDEIRLPVLEPLVAEIAPQALFMAGLALVVVMALRWRRRRRRADACSSDALKETGADFRPGQPTPYAALEVQVLETSRDLMGELNTKIAIVQRLVLEARQQSERLEALLERAERLAPSLDRADKE